MSFVFADFRYAARQLLARPAFALFAILSLAIGVGAETTLFSAVNTYLFSGVQGVGAPQELVEIDGTWRGNDYTSFSYPDYRDFAERIKPAAALFAYKLEAVNLTTNGEPQRGLSTLVSGNYFDTLQVTPYRGRLLNANDDRSDSSWPDRLLQSGVLPASERTIAAATGDGENVGQPEFGLALAGCTPGTGSDARSRRKGLVRDFRTACDRIRNLEGQ